MHRGHRTGSWLWVVIPLGVGGCVVVDSHRVTVGEDFARGGAGGVEAGSAAAAGVTAPTGAGMSGSNTGGGADELGGTGSTGTVGGSAGLAVGNGSGGLPASGAAAGAGGGSVAGQAGSAVATSSLGPPSSLAPLVTSTSGAYWKTSAALTETTDAPIVTVDDKAVAQKWDGFGGGFSELGWSYLSSPELQQQAMTLLFSATDGAAFAWGRIPIGANDYAVSRYTCDDTGTDVAPSADESNRPPPDFALASFSLERDRKYLIPYVKAAQAVNPRLRFWAMPWTPPVWMKTGYDTSSELSSDQPAQVPSYYDGGTMKSDAATLAAYAQYFTRFVQGYRSEGIDIELVAPQDEPTFQQNHPSCAWDKATYTTWVGQYLGPAMSQLGVRVMLGTLASAGTSDLDIAQAVLADGMAKSFVSVIGAEWNVLGQSALASLGSNLPIWGTDHKEGNYPWNPAGLPAYVNPAPNDQAYAIESWGYIRDAIDDVKVTSYDVANLVLDQEGTGIDTGREWCQDALLVAEAGVLTPTPVYYVFRHLSAYVVPGASVLGTSGGDAVAFENPDGSLVAVMFNSGAPNDHYVVALGGKKFTFAMPNDGWATVLYRPQ